MSPATGGDGGGWLARPLRSLTDDAPPIDRFVTTGLCAALALVAAGLLAGGQFAAGVVAVVLSFITGGARTAVEAVDALRARRLDIHFLMILAAVVSALLGYWGEGILLLFLFSLSDALEQYALHRTRNSVGALMDLRPATACVVREGREFTVPVEELQVGDRFRVRPGERFAVDGRVREGHSSADQSIVTGEAAAIAKGPGSPVLAGTINQDGTLLVEVTRRVDESTLARIVKLVQEAQAAKAPAQRFIERMEGPYVGLVLLMAALTVLGRLMVSGEFISSVKTGMILLVAASPCAVVLASPVAVLAAVTRGARGGVLFKGAAYLETLATVDTIAFDKTGTLTSGQPEVARIVCGPNTDERTLLQLAAAAESSSEHPIARAVVAAARAREIELPPVSHFQREAGMGLSARVAGERVLVGRMSLMQRFDVGVPPLLREQYDKLEGETAMLVVSEEGVTGMITLRDTLRPEARPAVDRLRELGLERLVLLTGDHAGPAHAVAEALRISECHAHLLPDEKVRIVRTMDRQGNGVAMVGDGVNDAPALAASSVGIAMGAAGSDVSLETADVVLMQDDLTALPHAIELARACRQRIQYGIMFACGVIAVLVGLTLAGVLNLPAAVVGHEGSTVVVIMYGLTLLQTPLQRGDRPAEAVGAAVTEKRVLAE